MSFNEVESLYIQCGQYLEDCDDYYKNIEKYIMDEREYVSDLFDKIEKNKSSNDIESQRKLLIEIRSYVGLLRSKPKVWKFEN